MTIMDAQLQPSHSGGMTAVIPGSPTRTVTRSPAFKREAGSTRLLSSVIRLADFQSILFSWMFDPNSIGTVPESSKYVDGLMTQPTPIPNESCFSVWIVHPSGSAERDLGMRVVRSIVVDDMLTTPP
jgi:hypothetical protein